MIVGAIVKLKRECLDNPKDTRGVCYAVYDKGNGEKEAHILFANGKYNGFSPEEQIETLIPIGISENIINYKFENVGKLMEDFRRGIFDAALKKKPNNSKDE